MRTRFWTANAAAFVVVGGLISSVLLARTFALLGDRGPDSWNLCAAVLHVDCDDTLRAASSWHLGVPLAGWGLLYYATLGSLLCLGVVLRENFADEAHAAACGLAVIGGLSSLALLAVMLSGRVSPCPLCFAIHGINLSLAPMLLQRENGTLGPVLARWRDGMAYVFGRPTPTPRQMAWKSVTFLIPALLAVSIYQWVFLEVTLRTRAKSAGPTAAGVIREYLAQSERDVPIEDADPQWGPADAPVTLVVFSSFTCTGCRELAHELAYLQDHFHGQLRVVFKHFPLSSECNPHVAAEKHPRACTLAVLAEASHRQGQFWPMHNALFALPGFDDRRLQQTIRQLPLDEPQLERDRQDPATWNKIRADAELGGELGVTATPTVYLNNRPVTPLDAGVIDILIHHLLGEPGH